MIFPIVKYIIERKYTQIPRLRKGRKVLAVTEMRTVSWKKIGLSKTHVTSAWTDTCFIGIPYRCHCWLEEKFLKPVQDNLYESFIMPKSGKISYSKSKRLFVVDLIWGIITGYPLCCSISYAREIAYPSDKENMRKCYKCWKKEKGYH